jgi:hypothetical protein
MTTLKKLELIAEADRRMVLLQKKWAKLLRVKTRLRLFQ